MANGSPGRLVGSIVIDGDTDGRSRSLIEGVGVFTVAVVEGTGVSSVAVAEGVGVSTVAVVEGTGVSTMAVVEGGRVVGKGVSLIAYVELVEGDGVCGSTSRRPPP